MQKTLSSSPFKSGFVAVMGKPNVGKSTLINALMGQKIAAVSPRPQTTRKRQLGILSLENAQIIFVDTPGMHLAHHKLGEYMNQEAIDTLEECDLILFVVDASQAPSDEDHMLANTIKAIKKPIATILAMNKIDRVEAGNIPDLQSDFLSIIPNSQPIPISATRGDNLIYLSDEIIRVLPEGPLFFPEDQITDLYEREIAADLIREAALIILRDEVPHSIAIRIDQFTERGDHGAYIEATIFVERESQKGIVIGKGGMMLKRIGTAARLEIETMTGRKIYLQLRVKVRKNWRNDKNVLRWFGY
jgi:GTP-binding protein Era